MTSIRLTLALSLLASALPANAGDAPPASPAAAAPAKYELKHRSVIQLPESSRPPFWPIGWSKRAAGGATPTIATAPKITLDEKSFSVTSILLGNPPLAVINGRSYTEGEFIRTPKSSSPVRIRVQRIMDGGVVLSAEDQMVTAMLRRPELEQRRIEEPRLNEDR